jgi:hypothetical protein
MGIRRWNGVFGVVALCGCTSLLPKGQIEVLSPFSKYQDVRAAFEKVVPYSTTLAGLKTLGFDTQASTNVRDEQLVLFRNHSGEPNIEKNEVRRNPLGPLQSFGETVP